MTNYSNGAAFERQVKAYLESKGAVCVRAAGSKGSHGIDLVAIFPGLISFIQCKTNGILPKKEKYALHGLVERFKGYFDGNLHSYLAFRKKKGRKYEIELKRINGEENKEI